MGKALIDLLANKDHEITIFTRGTRPVPPNVEHLKGDRGNLEDLRILQGRKFDLIADISGRTLVDTQSVLAMTGPPLSRFLYVSSAGVYANSNLWPLTEDAALDPKSRHLGKAQTENWLLKENIPFTSFRPTYIYGPGNYNPIEKWFFDRLINNRPVPIPGDGSLLTQLGHVNDLAHAMAKSLEYEVSINKIYNCSSNHGVTLRGLVEIAGKVCGKSFDQIEIRSFDPSGLDPKARKAFPLRIGHFLTDVNRIQNELNWAPIYDLEKGLSDSFKNDYLLNKTKITDLNSDHELIGP